MTSEPTPIDAFSAAEKRFIGRLKACRITDKMNYRLGEVTVITGFSQEALLKIRNAGGLKPWRPAGYHWDCYPREQVKTLLGNL